MNIYICPYCGMAVEKNTFLSKLNYNTVEVIDMDTGKTVNTLKTYDFGTEVVCPGCGRKLQADEYREMVI